MCVCARPCTAGRLFLLVVISISSLQFLYDVISLYMYVRTSFSGPRRCVCMCVSLILIRRARPGTGVRVYVWVCVNAPVWPGIFLCAPEESTELLARSFAYVCMLKKETTA